MSRYTTMDDYARSLREWLVSDYATDQYILRAIELFDAQYEQQVENKEDRELRKSIEHDEEYFAAQEREEEEERNNYIEQQKQLFLQAKIAQIQTDTHLRDEMFAKYPKVFKMLYELDPETIEIAEQIIAEECKPA